MASTGVLLLVPAERGWADDISLRGNVIDGATPAITQVITDMGVFLNTSTVTIFGNLTFGWSNPGDLVIQNGGTLSNVEGVIGYGVGSVGSVTVSGPGSTWTNSGNLYVGGSETSNGTLTIQNGGKASNLNGGVGYGVGSVGSVTVSGPGSTWTNAGVLYVGAGGVGTLTIQGGGKVSSGYSMIGYVLVNSTVASGAVTVSGSGSTWTNNELRVGVNGPGALTIDSGGTVVTTNLVLGDSTARASGTLNLGAGGVLETGSVQKSDGTGIFNLQGGVLRATRDNSNFIANFGPTDVRLSGSSTIDTQAYNIGLAPALSGTDGLVKQGTGTLTLSAVNTYTGGTLINAGTLALGPGGSLAATSGVNLFGAGAVFDISGSGANQTIGALTGAAGTSVALGANTLTLGDNGPATFGGSIGGTGGVVKQGAGTQTLTGANIYVGGTTINTGTLALGAGGSLSAISAVSLAGAGATFDISLAGGDRTIGSLSGVAGSTIALGFNRLTFGDVTNQIFAGSIDGDGGINKQYSGRQTLTGTSTYGGTTLVSAGELRVDGALNGPGALTVAAGATLSGTGSIAGAVTVNGTLSAGHSPGTLTVGSLALNGGSTSVFELNSPGVVGGSDPIAGNDLVEVTGNLTLGGTLDARAAAAGYYRLFDYGGTLAGSFASQGVTSTRSGFTIASAQVETATAGQVNLAVFGTGQTLQFWDGTNTIGNGTVNGGAGTWAPFGTNWTNSAGSSNAGWGGSVGVFAGAAGGAVSVAGTASFDTLQFSANGYALSGGTLSILPAGGTSGTFNVDNGVIANIASTIADGSGTAIAKAGNGRLVLSGSNSYSGGTAVEGGVLQISANANLGAASGGLSLNGGTLATTASFASFRPVALDGPGGFDVAAGTQFELGGTVSGAGSLTKLGAGTQILTGANTYTGGTTISGGVLQIGNGGTSGSIIGNVVNNRTLAFNRSDDITFAGTISGGGDVQKLGAGSLTLTGTNSYGGTLIQAGTLIGSAMSFGLGPIHNNAALVFDQPGDATFAQAINGTGTLTKRGAGNLNLTGDGNLIGATTVEDGKLSVNASFENSAVTVLSGAALGGSGTVGSTTIQSGATIAPGNSIGTLNVNGNLTLAPGSTYEAEIAGNGTSDRIAVTGSAIVTGSQVGVTALDPQTSYVNGERYTILTATGGVTGSAPGAVSRSAFLDLSVDQQPDQIDLIIAVKGTPPVTPPGSGPTPTPPPAIFETVAQTRNQFATAGALDTLLQVGGTLALYNSLLMLDAPGARAAFDSLSGEVHASAKTALIDESWLLRNAVNDRLRSAFGAVGAQPMTTLNYGFTADLAPSVKGPMPELRSDRFAVWGQGYGSWGTTDSDRNAAKLTRSTGGFLIGADAAVFDTLRVGVIAGYSRSEFDVKGRRSSGESDNYHLGLYGGGQWGALNLRTGASYTWHDVEISRTVAFAGFGNSLKADYNAGTAQVFGELGYRVDLGRVAFEPFAGLAYVNLHTDGFRETSGAAALSSRGGDTNVGYSTLGLRAATSFDLRGVGLTLRGGLAWRHAFGDVTPTATLAFAGSTPFSVAGVPIAKDAALLEAGLDLAIGQSASLGLSYTGQLAQDAQDHAFKGVLAVRF
ncbi:outer membrane autotransporter protein [Bosea sp. OAE752]|uniref:autotransporter domain-containing protein n=1 Tax=Bosea sp. OAE752 TaxID=2663873 RepID=UPI0016399279